MAKTSLKISLHRWGEGFLYSATCWKQYKIEAVVQKCSVKKVFIEISQNWQESTCARASFLTKRLWHRCFPVNFVKFLRTHFYLEHPWCYFRQKLNGESVASSGSNLENNWVFERNPVVHVNVARFNFCSCLSWSICEFVQTIWIVPKFYKLEVLVN